MFGYFCKDTQQLYLLKMLERRVLVSKKGNFYFNFFVLFYIFNMYTYCFIMVFVS